MTLTVWHIIMANVAFIIYAFKSQTKIYARPNKGFQFDAYWVSLSTNQIAALLKLVNQRLDLDRFSYWCFKSCLWLAYFKINGYFIGWDWHSANIKLKTHIIWCKKISDFKHSWILCHQRQPIFSKFFCLLHMTLILLGRVWVQLEFELCYRLLFLENVEFALTSHDWIWPHLVCDQFVPSPISQNLDLG